jgi:hypothetical protein
MAPRLPFMCGQLCVRDGAGEGVADPTLTAVVAVPDDEDVVEVVCVVAAPATAMLAPNPAPSAPAPITVPTMILLSVVFMHQGHPRELRAGCGDDLFTV